MRLPCILRLDQLGGKGCRRYIKDDLVNISLTQRCFRSVLVLIILFSAAEVLAGGWSANDAGAYRVGMWTAVTKADDPTAVWHNPSGLLHRSGSEINASALAGFATAEFRIFGQDPDTREFTLSDVQKPVLNYGAFPFFGYATDFGLERWRFGVASFFPNFTGGSLRENAPTRYHLVEGFFASNFTSFAASYKVSDQLYLGFAVDGVYALTIGYTKLNLALQLEEDDPFLPLAEQFNDFKLQFEVDQFQVSWHAGLTYMPVEGVRMGITYYPEINFLLEGEVDVIPTGGDQDVIYNLTGGPNGGIRTINTKISETQISPQTIKIGFLFDINERWQWGFEFYWWDYSKWDEKIRRFPDLADDYGDIPILGDAITGFLGEALVSPANFDDSYQIGGGVEYIVNENWTVRGGISYDDSPIPNSTFSIDTLTSDNIGIGGGFAYTKDQKNVFSFSYQRIFFKTRRIRDSLTSPPTNGQIEKSFTDSVMLEYKYRW